MKTLLKTIGIVSTLIGSSFLFQNCSEKESIPEGIIPPTDSVSSKIEIKNFSIEAQIHTSPDSTVTMQGEASFSFNFSYLLPPNVMARYDTRYIPFNDEHTDYLSTGSCTHINNYRRIFLVFQQIWYYVNSPLVSQLSLCYYELIKS